MTSQSEAADAEIVRLRESVEVLEKALKSATDEVKYLHRVHNDAIDSLKRVRNSLKATASPR